MKYLNGLKNLYEARYTKLLFTNIQKQYSLLKSSLFFKENANFTGN